MLLTYYNINYVIKLGVYFKKTSIFIKNKIDYFNCNTL